MEINIELFSTQDDFKKPHKVRIFDGNIIPKIPKSLPGCTFERVNFKYDIAPTYSDMSKGKINTRFQYPYCNINIAMGHEGFCTAYAHLNYWQKIKLSFIKHNTIFHKHPKPIIFIILNIIGLIPLWIPYFSDPLSEKNNQANNPDSKIEIINNNKQDVHEPIQQDSIPIEKDTTIKK